MAKVTLSFPIASVSGKICKHEDIILTRRNGEIFMSKRCNARTSPLSDAEIAQRARFTAAMQELKATLGDPTKKAQAIAGYKAQTKYKTLNGYIVANAMANL